MFGIDDPQFVQDMCTFLRSHPTETEEFFTSKPGSIFDLGNKPKSRAAYRHCITPLTAPLPSWAIGGAGSATVVSLSLGGPAAGGDVTLPVTAKLTVPIAQWQLDFGDGAVASGAGTPPASIEHHYADGHSYEPVLVVYSSPPFTTDAIRFFTSTSVADGDPPALQLTPSVNGGKVSFRIQSSLPRPVTSWTLLYGDGLTNAKTGALPRFAGHTYKPGAYTALLVASLAGGGRVIETATVQAT